MKFIGITGGVGAGKSTVLSFLEDNYNVMVLRTDELAQELMLPGTELNDRLHIEFQGLNVFDADGAIDRKKMAEAIFTDKSLLARMNNLVHPAVKAAVIKMAEDERARGQIDVFFVEAALLIEDHYDEVCDGLWYIYADEGTRRERLKKSRGYSDSKIDNIFSAQLSDDVFREHCEVIINNSYEEEETYDQIDIEMEFLLDE